MQLANWGTIAQQLVIGFKDIFKLLLFCTRREYWCTPLALADTPPMSLKEEQSMSFFYAPKFVFTILFKLIFLHTFNCIFNGFGSLNIYESSLISVNKENFFP